MMLPINVKRNRVLYELFGLFMNEKADVKKCETKNQKINTRMKSKHKTSPEQLCTISKNSYDFNIEINDKIVDKVINIYQNGKSADALKVLSTLIKLKSTRNKYLSTFIASKQNDTAIALKGSEYVDESYAHSEEYIILEKHNLNNINELALMIENGYELKTIYVINHPEYLRNIHPAIKELMLYLEVTYIPVMTDGFITYPWNYFKNQFYTVSRYYGGDVKTAVSRLKNVILLNNSDMSNALILSKIRELKSNQIVKVVSGRKFLITFKTKLRTTDHEVHMMCYQLGNIELNRSMKEVAASLLLYGSCLTNQDVLISSSSIVTKICCTNRNLFDPYAMQMIASIDNSLDNLITARNKPNKVDGEYYINVGVCANKGSGKTKTAQYLVNLFLNIPKVKDNNITVGYLDSDAYNVYLKYGNQSETFRYDELNAMVEQYRTGMYEDIAFTILESYNIDDFRKFQKYEDQLVLLMTREYEKYIQTDDTPSLRAFIMQVATHANRPDILFVQIHNDYEIPSLHSTENIMSLTPIWNLERAVLERGSDASMRDRLIQLLLLKTFEKLSLSTRASSYFSSYALEVNKRYGTFLSSEFLTFEH